MRIKKIVPIIVISLLFLPFISIAAPQRGGWVIQDVLNLMDTVADWLYVIGFALALIIIVIGGISYMTAGGNEEQEKKAKQTIIKGLIGAAIILVAGILLDTLENIIGTSLPT